MISHAVLPLDLSPLYTVISEQSRARAMAADISSVRLGSMCGCRRTCSIWRSASSSRSRQIRCNAEIANALLDLVKAKQAGREFQPVAAPQPANVINLMDALRRSIAAEKAEAEKSRDRGACRRRRDPAQETRGSSRHRTRQSPQGAEQEQSESCRLYAVFSASGAWRARGSLPTAAAC